jgi:3-phenylpropionate/trans-cinnamate dioxygenase ferredoxin subunit
VTAGERTQACAAAELAPGEKSLVRGGRRDLLLCRAGDGAFYAVGTICPHQGAPLVRGTLGGTAVADGVGRYGFGLDGEVLRCPWHGWEFDVKTGRSLFGEGTARIATYEVTVEDGVVFVADAPARHTKTTKGEEPQ